MVKTFTSWLKHGTAPVLALETPKRGPFLLLWPFEALRGYREMLKTRDFARREEGDVRFGGYLPCTMVSEIFLRSRSTFSTHTLTVSPTRRGTTQLVRTIS